MLPGCQLFIEYPIEKGSVELVKGEPHVKLGFENLKLQTAILNGGFKRTVLDALDLPAMVWADKAMWDSKMDERNRRL
jgi:hypothetical protein